RSGPAPRHTGTAREAQLPRSTCTGTRPARSSAARRSHPRRTASCSPHPCAPRARAHHARGSTKAVRVVDRDHVIHLADSGQAAGEGVGRDAELKTLAAHIRHVRRQAALLALAGLVVFCGEQASRVREKLVRADAGVVGHSEGPVPGVVRTDGPPPSVSPHEAVPVLHPIRSRVEDGSTDRDGDGAGCLTREDDLRKVDAPARSTRRAPAGVVPLPALQEGCESLTYADMCGDPHRRGAPHRARLDRDGAQRQPEASQPGESRPRELLRDLLQVCVEFSDLFRGAVARPVRRVGDADLHAGLLVRRSAGGRSPPLPESYETTTVSVTHTPLLVALTT